MTEFATSSGHWYDLDGTPRYTIVGANGKERNTTLRDARQHRLVPSVTTIIRMAAAPALEKWKRDQVMLAALTLPRNEGEAEAEWLKRVEQDWQEQGRVAADRGTAIHAAIEKHYRGEIPDEAYWDHVKVASKAIASACGEQQWSMERSFACSQPFGHGGKTDLFCHEWVNDIKTKEGDVSIAKPWDEHAMQLAAYRRGLGLPAARCGILFVSRDIASARFCEIHEAELVQGLAMFDALLAFWYAKTQLVAA